MHQITLRGTTTLLTKNIQLGDPENEFVQAIGKLNALKTKITEAQRLEREYLKWRGGLYWDAEVGAVMPAPNVFRSIQQAAALTRQGKDVERGLIIHDLESVLEYDGPRDLKSMWADSKGPNVDRRMAVINRAPVACTRPKFNEWTCTFHFDLDEDILSLDDFVFLAEKAGRLIHIGDYRRFFGAYTVKVN